MQTTEKPAISIKNARLAFGSRTLWDNLSIDIAPGEFIAVLGPNGAGKTSFLKVLLGLVPLTSGTITFKKENVRESIGYIPQQKSFDPDLPIRGRDFVELGVNGHHYGWCKHNTQTARIDSLIEKLGATSYADAPLGLLSGGEQQRLRIAQAFANKPSYLLCDEPFLSLDIASQQQVSELVADEQNQHKTTVVFITHDLNPAILPLVDRVLYLVNGKWAIGTPEEVLTSKRLTALYGTPVDVIRVRGRILIVTGSGETAQEAARRNEEN